MGAGFTIGDTGKKAFHPYLAFPARQRTGMSNSIIIIKTNLFCTISHTKGSLSFIIAIVFAPPFTVSHSSTMKFVCLFVAKILGIVHKVQQKERKKSKRKRAREPKPNSAALRTLPAFVRKKKSPEPKECGRRKKKESNGKREGINNNKKRKQVKTRNKKKVKKVPILFFLIVEFQKR